MQSEEKLTFGQKLQRTSHHLWQKSLSAWRNSAIKFYSWLNRHSTAHLEKLLPNQAFKQAPSSAPQSEAKLRSSHLEQPPRSSFSSHSSAPLSDRAQAPQTITEFLDLMRRTPRSVLSQRERQVIAAIMNFPDTKVSTVMLPPSAITYVRFDEILGPLTLDRLYQSGYQHFPVLDDRHRIIGLIHTTALNSLEIKQTNRADEILDPKVYYLREDYTLNQALAAFLRTNCYFFLVVDRFERIVGILTYQMLVDYLLGETPTDDFDRDSDRLAVAKRQL